MEQYQRIGIIIFHNASVCNTLYHFNEEAKNLVTGVVLQLNMQSVWM